MKAWNKNVWQGKTKWNEGIKYSSLIEIARRYQPDKFSTLVRRQIFWPISTKFLLLIFLKSYFLIPFNVPVVVITDLGLYLFKMLTLKYNLSLFKDVSIREIKESSSIWGKEKVPTQGFKRVKKWSRHWGTLVRAVTTGVIYYVYMHVTRRQSFSILAVHTLVGGTWTWAVGKLLCPYVLGF